MRRLIGLWLRKCPLRPALGNIALVRLTTLLRLSMRSLRYVSISARGVTIAAILPLMTVERTVTPITVAAVTTISVETFATETALAVILAIAVEAALALFAPVAVVIALIVVTAVLIFVEPALIAALELSIAIATVIEALVAVLPVGAVLRIEVAFAVAELPAPATLAFEPVEPLLAVATRVLRERTVAARVRLSFAGWYACTCLDRAATIVDHRLVVGADPTGVVDFARFQWCARLAVAEGLTVRAATLLLGVSHDDAIVVFGVLEIVLRQNGVP